MGARLSTQQKVIYRYLKDLMSLQKTGHPVDKKALKTLAKWLDEKGEHVPEILNLEDWDNIGFSIWVEKERRVSSAAEALLAWRLVLTALQSRMKTKKPEPHSKSSRRGWLLHDTQNGGGSPIFKRSCSWAQNGGSPEGEGRSHREARNVEGRGRRKARETMKAREIHVRERFRPCSPSDTPSSASSSSSLTSLTPSCHNTVPGRDVSHTSVICFRKDGGTHGHHKAYRSGNPLPNDIWKACKAQALQAGDTEFLKAFPVFYDNAETGPEWFPISYPILRDNKKAVTDYGLSAPFTLGLLDTLFQAHTLIPHDVRVIAKGLLTTIQYSVFENEWKDLIVKHVNDKLPKRKAPTDHLVNMMYGEGPFTDKKQQIGIRREYLQISQDLALQALKKVADAYTSVPSFTMIQQGQDESFIDFISRLKEAIVKQVNQKES
ncbi:hypothetical protein BTVI_41594 [Pitangus sulphuratus]|nr:hypothetical protein BTVI_41594 [Pitangus sulphuratus]